MRAECGCYLGLRPHLATEPKFKGGFDNLIPLERRPAWVRLYAHASESQVFKFWSDQFAEGVAELIIEPFEALFKIALVQRSVLDREPVEWAKMQIANLIYELSRTLPFKLKEMCDAHQPRTDFSTENFGSYCAWMYWRAPRFIHMQPSGNTFYDPETAWEREDAEKTERLVLGLSSRMLDYPRFKLDSLAGESYVSLASTPPPANEPATPKVTSGSISALSNAAGAADLNLPPVEADQKRIPLTAKCTDLSNYFDQAPLTERQRECMSLRFEYELTLSDIAERLNLNRKTVDEHIAAAERKLRMAKIKDKGQAKRPLE